MRKTSFIRHVLLAAWLLPIGLHAQSWKADSWQQVSQAKRGAITALWYDIEPFIYVNKDGRPAGIEYEIMESLKPYLKDQYGIDLTIEWVNAGSFENIYHQVKQTSLHGVLGWSYYSITPERKKEVQFTLPYMPDVNVLVTNVNEPEYATPQELLLKLHTMQAYTMSNTTMEEDIDRLKTNFAPSLKVHTRADDYEVMKRIAEDKKGFGYVPLSVYITGLQRGIRVKRQHVLASHREGFAAVLPKQSDWKPVLDEYFKTAAFQSAASGIVSKYLGSEVRDLVFGPSTADSVHRSLNLELVSLEKEIVTKRLVDTATEVQRQRNIRNMLMVAGAFLLLVALLLYNRFRTRQRMNLKLEQRNQLISRQNETIEQMNQLLKLKVLQARMNPHFLFNSLNSIQYFITLDDKKNSLQYINRFAAFLRKVIHFGDELSISIQNEAELLQEYLWLEHTRFPGQFEYEIRVPGNIQQKQILPLLTHGLVEAALYKGVLNLESGVKGKIVVDFEEVEDRLVVKVSDNGMSRAKAQELEKRKGLGNEEDMVSRRINLFNRQGQRKIRLKMGVEGGMNEACLEIPQPLFQ
jgi:Putative regulator of cell autolysis